MSETREPGTAGRYTFLLNSRPAPANTVIRFVCNAAGGWGDPLDRDPERVRRDVRDEYVTIDGAARDYGVVVTGNPATDPVGAAVDCPATEKLRAARRYGRDVVASAGEPAG